MRTALVLIGMMFVCAPTSAQQDWTRVAERVRESVVPLSYPEDQNSGCSGFVFGKQRQYIVTARHCVIDETGKAWETRLGDHALQVVRDYGPEELIVLSPGRGLMFRMNALELGNKPKVGQPVLALGFFGLIPDETTAMALMVSALDKSFHHRIRPGLVLNGMFLKGHSGGPIVDRDGKVVSVVACSGLGSIVGIACGPGWDVMSRLPHD